MSSIAHAQGSKDHHSGNGFVNPWPSFINHGLSSMPKAFTSIDMKAMYGKKLEHEKPEIVPMDWNSLNKVQEDGPEDIIQTTWLGQ
jgi:hypothetical protein